MKRSPLIILFITIFIDLLGFGLVIPLIPIYIQHYGGEPWVGGVLLACYSMMQFIFSPIWGRLSDRVGRRPLILLSLFGSAVSYIAFGAAGTLTVLFIARVSGGILSAASLPSAYAYIADVTPPEKRAGGMAIIGAAFGLGFAFGPAISGPLSQHPVLGIAPLAMPAYFAALLCGINFIWALVNLPETHTERSPQSETKGVPDIFNGIGKALRDPAVKYQLTVFAFTTFAFTAVESSFSWLTILRFKSTIEQMAIAAWNGYSHLPLASVPLEVRRLIPMKAQWPSYASPGLASINASIGILLREKAAASITTKIFMIVGITILIVQVAVMRGIASRFGEKRLIIVGAFILTITHHAVWHCYGADLDFDRGTGGIHCGW
jgi:multidrug resistance protein